MTPENAIRIKALKDPGMGYKRLAKQLGMILKLSRLIVK
jgi:hypothetical protein